MCKNQVWPSSEVGRHLIQSVSVKKRLFTSRKFFPSAVRVTQFREAGGAEKHNLSVNTVLKCETEADFPPNFQSCVVVKLWKVDVTGSFWQHDWSWLHTVCSEVTLLSGFIWLASSLVNTTSHPLKGCVKWAGLWKRNPSYKDQANLHLLLHAKMIRMVFLFDIFS